jgi:membrane-associated phospholipid phosphatase
MKAALLVLALLLPSSGAAADLGELKEIPRDLWGGLKREAEPEGALTLLGAGAAASVARYGSRRYFDDFRLADTLKRRRPLGKRATDFGAVIGYPLYLIPAMAGTYFTGAYARAGKVQEFGLMGFEAVTLAGVQTEILKLSVPRLRPDSTDRAAFPSGHTSASFALATVAASQWGWEVGVPACMLASFVGFTRMENGSHYLSDVVFGAGLGIASGRAVFKQRRQKHPDRYVFAPFVTPGGGGFTMAF